MLTISARNELTRLSALFNATIKLEYGFKAAFKDGKVEEKNRHNAWHLEMNKDTAGWSNTWITNTAKGETESRRGVGASDTLSLTGASPEDVLRKLKSYTVDRTEGFLLSNHPFGLRMGAMYDDDDYAGPHMIRHMVGEKLIAEFPFDEEKVRAILLEMYPKEGQRKFGDDSKSKAAPAPAAP